MKKLCVVVLAVILLASAAPLWAQGSGKAEGGTAKAEKQPPPTRQELKKIVTALAGLVGEEGIKKLKGATSRFPFTGIGVTFEMESKTVDAATGREDFAVVVSSVYRGSPAERAGIQPGDWLTRVNGKPTCQIAVTSEDARSEERLNEKKKEYQSCMAATKESIQSGGDNVDLVVERQGRALAYGIKKTQIGQGIADFAAQHEAEWTAALRASEKDLSAFTAKMDASPDTPESLRALDEELGKIFQSAVGPFLALKGQLASSVVERQQQDQEQ